MMSFATIRTTAVAAIAAVAPFLADTTAERPMVHLDNGHVKKLEEASLREKGYYATVLPVIDGDIVNQGAKKAVSDVNFAVRVAIRPGGTSTMETLLPAVIGALLQWDPVVPNPADRFNLATNAFIFDESDPGEHAYFIYFTKRCVF